MVPIQKVYLLDTGGLVAIIDFIGKDYIVKITWPEKMSLFGSKLVALAMKHKFEKKSEFFSYKNLFMYIGDKYILVVQHKKESEKKLKRILRKVYEILVAVRSFDPKELGEVVAKAIIAEYTI